MLNGTDYVDAVRKAADTLHLLDASGVLVKLDSLAVVDFLGELEDAFDIEIPGEYLGGDTFASIESVAAMLQLVKGGRR